jgi:hypothetical protein
MKKSHLYFNFILAALLLNACSSDAENEGTSTLYSRLSNVPPQARCLRVFVDGDMIKSIDPSNNSENLTNLSLGSVEPGSHLVKVEGHQSTCSQVTTGSSAEWVSDETSVEVQSNEPAYVTSTIRPRSSSYGSTDGNSYGTPPNDLGVGLGGSSLKPPELFTVCKAQKCASKGGYIVQEKGICVSSNTAASFTDKQQKTYQYKRTVGQPWQEKSGSQCWRVEYMGSGTDNSYLGSNY